MSLTAESEFNKLSDEEQEQAHFQRIINAFKFYSDSSSSNDGGRWHHVLSTLPSVKKKETNSSGQTPYETRIHESAPENETHSLQRVNTAERNYQDIPDHHKKLIPNFKENLERIKTCIDHNYSIIKLILEDVDCMFENKDGVQQINNNDGQAFLKVISPTINDMEKVQSTLKQFCRDWSGTGADEREICYKPVIDEILEQFPPDSCDPKSVSVLVPGAGLGRLAFEIAKHGYNCQGNEWSLLMLFSSNFVLNKCKVINEFTLYPWLHQWVNLKKADDQTQAIQFPDINPGELPEGTEFSMTAGDFLEVYQESDSWDSIASVFFIDTAHNIIAYIETIWKILKPGGIWINLGPLLYHYAGITSEKSIEISYDELKKLILEMGFEIVKEEVDMRTSYTQNPNSMLRHEYLSVYFVVRKPKT